MGRRSPLPAFCKLLKLGTATTTSAATMTIRPPSPGGSVLGIIAVRQSSPKCKKDAHPHRHSQPHHCSSSSLEGDHELEDDDDFDDDAAHIHVVHTHSHRLWGSDRSTSSTASISTVATNSSIGSACSPFVGHEEEDDEECDKSTPAEDLYHGERMGPEVNVEVTSTMTGSSSSSPTVLMEETIPPRKTSSNPSDPAACATSTTTTTKHVHFARAEIRVYPQVMGDHPCCSQGCPLELGWEYEREEVVNMQDWNDEDDGTKDSSTMEGACGTSRTCSSTTTNAWCHKLTPEERLAILAPKYSLAEVRKVCRRQARAFELRHKEQQQRLQEFFFLGTGKKPARPLNTR